MNNLTLNEEEQDFLKIFGSLSKQEIFEVFEDSIRDAKDDSERKVLRYLFSMLKESYQEEEDNHNGANEIIGRLGAEMKNLEKAEPSETLRLRNCHRSRKRNRRNLQAKRR